MDNHWLTVTWISQLISRIVWPHNGIQTLYGQTRSDDAWTDYQWIYLGSPTISFQAGLMSNGIQDVLTSMVFVSYKTEM